MKPQIIYSLIGVSALLIGFVIMISGYPEASFFFTLLGIIIYLGTNFFKKD